MYESNISPEVHEGWFARRKPTELGGHTGPASTRFQQIELTNDPSIPLTNFAMSTDGAVVHERVDLSYGGIRRLTIKSHVESSLNVSYSQSEPTETDLDVDHLIALADLRECIGRQMVKCPTCDTEQVQLMDNLTNPLSPSWRCRSCKHRFHTTPTIPFTLLIRAKYGDLLKGQPVAAYLEENDPAAIPVHICKTLCCMNDGSNALLPPYSVRLLTEAERLFFSKAKSFNISTTELFDAMADEEPKYGQ